MKTEEELTILPLSNIDAHFEKIQNQLDNIQKMAHLEPTWVNWSLYRHAISYAEIIIEFFEQLNKHARHGTSADDHDVIFNKILKKIPSIFE